MDYEEKNYSETLPKNVRQKAREFKLILKRAISVFGGYYNGSIIDEEGNVYLLDGEDPHKVPGMFAFGIPAKQVVSCYSFSLVLLNDNSVYGLFLMEKARVLPCSITQRAKNCEDC